MVKIEPRLCSNKQNIQTFDIWINETSNELNKARYSENLDILKRLRTVRCFKRVYCPSIWCFEETKWLWLRCCCCCSWFGANDLKRLLCSSCKMFYRMQEYVSVSILHIRIIHSYRIILKYSSSYVWLVLYNEWLKSTTNNIVFCTYVRCKWKLSLIVI